MDEAGRTGLIEEAIAPVVADHGLQLVDVEWRELRPRGDRRLRAPEPGDRRRARRRGTDRGRLRSRSVLARTRSTVAQGTGVSLGRRPADPVLAGGGRRGRWPAYGGHGGSAGAGPRGRAGRAWPRRRDEGAAGGGGPLAPQGVESQAGCGSHEPRADQCYRADPTGEG